MHVFKVAFYTSGVYYALFIDRTVLLPFFAILAIYCIGSALLPGAKPLSTRKKIMAATWDPPSDPSIIIRGSVRVETIQKIIDSLPKESKLSPTHFCIKACGQLLAAQPFLNGSLVMGKVTIVLVSFCPMIRLT